MRYTKLLVLFALPLIVASCGNGKKLSKQFQLELNVENNKVSSDKKVQISLQSKANAILDSVIYRMDENVLARKTDTSPYTLDLSDKRLGKRQLTAVLFSEGATDSIHKTLTVLAPKGPQLYSYELLNTYPHNTGSYTQGLEFHEGTLYESVGEYGESALLKVNYETGEILKKIKLDDKYFAEGLTIINDRLLQLTWREGLGFIYDLDDFSKQGEFAYNESKEGWGLCNDGEQIYKSDGSTKIWTLNPENLTETDYIEVVDNKAVRSKYNELEWVNGKIYGNTYQNDGISIIDPKTGAIEAVIDLRNLKKQIQKGLNEQDEVLNGIAYNPERNSLFVTGKHWNKLFEIKVLPKK